MTTIDAGAANDRDSPGSPGRPTLIGNTDRNSVRDLYQEVILDHQRSPRHFGIIPGAEHCSTGDNPLCGDHVTVYLNLKDDAVTDVSFQGTGCAICTASASMMTEQVLGKSLGQIETISRSFQSMLTGDSREKGNADTIGKLKVFAGVRQFPMRVKCATLPWHTLRAAVEGGRDPVSTE